MSTNNQHNSKPPDQDYKNSSQEIDGFMMIAGFGRKIFSDKLVLHNFVIFFTSIFFSNYIEVANCLATLGFLLAMKNWSLLKKNIYDEFIKLAWGVQIQSAKSTLFAILFMLIASLVLSILINSIESLSKNFSFSEKQTIYFIDNNQEIKIKKLSENQKIEQEILKNKIGEKIDDHLSGLGDIMIGIGSALMALSIFVYESIARKRSYFNKYFLTGLTNNIILTILYFIGLLGLLLVYVMENYNWVKNFLEPALFCYVFLLIIFAGMRFIRIAIGLLFRDEEIKIEKEIVESYGNYVFKKYLNKKLYNDDGEKKYYEFLEDFFSDTIRKLRDKQNHMVKDDWNVIIEFYKSLINLVASKKIPYIDHEKFNRFIVEYFHEMSTEFYLETYSELISCPRRILKIILEEKYSKQVHEFQNYLNYYQAMYQKGFEMQKELDKLSSNEKSIANILLDRSRQTPKDLTNHDLLSNYRNNKINPEFFENYAIEFLIYFRDLALKCFENNDVDNFDKTLNELKDLFKQYQKTEDKIFDRLKQYKEAFLFCLGAYILSEAKITDKENNIENIRKFLAITNQNLNKVLQTQLNIAKNLIEYFENNEEKVIKIFCYIKANQTHKYLSGIMISKNISGWMSESDEYVDDYLIYFLLGFNNIFFSNNISKEIFLITGLDYIPSLFIGIFKKLKSFESKKLNADPILKLIEIDDPSKLLTKENQETEFFNRVTKLKDKIERINIAVKESRDNEISKKPIILSLVNEFKNNVIKSYKEFRSIKNIAEIFRKEFNPNKSSEKIYYINQLLEREYFVGSNLSLIGFFGEIMQEGENKEMVNKILDKIPAESQQIDLNKFHDIILQIPNIKDAVIILLSSPYNLTRELKKRTFYNDNYKSLNDEDKKLYPKKYNKEQIGFYEIFVKNKAYEIPVYNYFSDKEDGVMVLDKSRLGKIIQYDISEDYKERESAKLQIEEFLQEQKYDENFTKEFYLDLIEFNDNNQYFKNLLDPDKQPDWIKQKGDGTEQIKFLQQHLIFIFKQSFEVEFAKDFVGYLFEVKKEY